MFRPKRLDGWVVAYSYAKAGNTPEIRESCKSSERGRSGKVKKDKNKNTHTKKKNQTSTFGMIEDSIRKLGAFTTEDATPR